MTTGGGVGVGVGVGKGVAGGGVGPVQLLVIIWNSPQSVPGLLPPTQTLSIWPH